MKNFPKGSEWRKWDLHFHTPASYDYEYMNASDWEISRVLIEEQISLVAITDHHFIDCDRIFRIKAMLNDKITVLPGIELRTDKGGSKAIHIIGIFPETLNLEELKDIWTKLSGKLNLTPMDIASKGKENIYCNLEETCEIIKEIGGIITIHAGTKSNSIEEISNSLQFKMSQKKELCECVDIFEIGKKDDEDNYRKIVYPKINMVLPMILCSDNHDIRNLEYKEKLWIKADPTFEGLKQIIYEPEERVYIGDNPPRKIDSSKIIKSITFSQTNTWLPDGQTFELNSDMVSIIGGKGTGKTALLDLIALAAGTQVGKENSFINKAKDEISNINIILKWENGEKSEIPGIDNKRMDNLKRDGLVRYLPQDYVETLCNNTQQEMLESEIENVIFQRIDKSQKSGYSNFSEYKTELTKIINNKKDSLKQVIEKTNKKIYDNELIIIKESKFKEQLDLIKNEKDEAEKQRAFITESLKQSGTDKTIEELNILNENKTKMETQISAQRKKLLDIEVIQNEVNQLEEEVKERISDIANSLKEIGITDIQDVCLKILPENLKDIINQFKATIEKDFKDKNSELVKINEKIKEINSTLNIEKTKHENLTKLNEKIEYSTQQIETLNKNIAEIQQLKSLNEELNDKRINAYIEYIECIYEEKKRLKEIYKPLITALSSSGEENERLFEFSVNINHELETFCNKIDQMINHQVEGRYFRREKEALLADIKDIWFVLSSDDEDLSDSSKTQIKESIKKACNLFIIGQEGDKKTIAEQLRKGFTEVDFYNCLLNPEFYKLGYNIIFNKTSLSKLSPGLKGVALLILFLELDQYDNRPLLIDQPEENLDNRSVYKTLVKYFRKAKSRRQVIIATHNPNLVVNTDCEQVFVANWDKDKINQPYRISYNSGSLENTFKKVQETNILLKQGIREHICEILEGGQEAFEKREAKYGFKD